MAIVGVFHGSNVNQFHARNMLSKEKRYSDDNLDSYFHLKYILALKLFSLIFLLFLCVKKIVYYICIYILCYLVIERKGEEQNYRCTY